MNFPLTPEQALEGKLRAHINRANGKHFAFTICKSFLPELLPEDGPLHPVEIFAASAHSIEALRLPETSMDKLRKIAERLGMTVETDSNYCRIRDVIRLEKPAASKQTP